MMPDFPLQIQPESFVSSLRLQIQTPFQPMAALRDQYSEAKGKSKDN